MDRPPNRSEILHVETAPNIYIRMVYIYTYIYHSSSLSLSLPSSYSTGYGERTTIDPDASTSGNQTRPIHSNRLLPHSSFPNDAMATLLYLISVLLIITSKKRTLKLSPIINQYFSFAYIYTNFGICGAAGGGGGARVWQ